MKRSTAGFVAYDLRPAKQTERRLLLDFLKCNREPVVNLSKCRYVGMGGTQFYDFHLLHRFLGMNEMISLERDEKMHARSYFNRPFNFITVRNETVATFLASDASAKTTIYWLDYDDRIGPDVATDITSLGARLKIGGFAFVTVCGELPGYLHKERNGDKKLASFQETLGGLATGLSKEDMEEATFPLTVHRILMTAFTNAFASRVDGVFQPLFQIRYHDTVDMITVGGCFNTKEAAPAFLKRVKTDLPFLVGAEPYRIRNFTLTQRERALFDTAVTTKRKNSKHKNSLSAIGFKKSDLDAYRDLIRFLPRYYESII